MHYILLYLLLLTSFSLHAQEKQYKIAVVAFYNLENLHDTIDDPKTNDADFLPNGINHYNTVVLNGKLNNLSKVISELGADMNPDGPAILGVAEVENRTVLEYLVAHKTIASRNYQIVHYDSPDIRGIDVGLLYNPKYFKVLHSQPLFVALPVETPGDTSYTRDVLWVYGLLDGDPIHVFVNHWPSRRGGEVASNPRREIAAATCRKVIDSLMAIDPNVKVIVMGDLNDDPINTSLTQYLKAEGKVNKLEKGELFNPFYDNFKKGNGTIAWQDSWGLFDQIIVSQALLNKQQKGYFYFQNHVFNKLYLTQASGQFKGYPWRTYVGGEYVGGYSDHFPVYIYLLKEKQLN